MSVRRPATGLSGVRFLGPLLGLILALSATLSACETPPKTTSVVVLPTDEGLEDSPVDAQIDRGLDAGPGDVVRVPRALLLDFELRAPIGWSVLIHTLEDAGVEVTYRRWFPHPTEADLGGNYDVVFIAAGGAPATPVAALRSSSVAPLAEFVREGGHLVLLPLHGWRDGPRSANDRPLFNAVLSALDAPLAIEANTLIGEIAQEVDGRPPHHRTWPWAYPSSLEWTLQLPVAFPGSALPTLPVEAFAAGWIPSLSCDGRPVRVWARSHADVILWRRLGGAPAEQTVLPGEAQPLAATAPIADGYVSILPRGFVEAAVHSAVGADQPILEPALLEGTRRIAEAVLSEIAATLSDTAADVWAPCAPSVQPLIHEEPPARPLDEGPFPLSAPRPPAWAEPAPPPVNDPPARPPWFGAGRARMAYGDLLSGDAMTAVIEVAVSSRLDGLIATFPPAFLIDYDRARAPFLSVAEEIAEHPLALFLGVHFMDTYTPALRAELGQAIGPRGVPLAAPPPLDPRWWTEVMDPLYLGAAKAVSHAPGITGVLMDLELYGAHSLAYEDGFAFDDAAWSTITAALAVHDAALAERARAAAITERMNLLLDRGLLGFAYGQLEEAVARHAATLRERVRSRAPTLEFAFYSHAVRNTWFYRGLFRGLGTPSRPVLWLTYDLETAALQARLNAEGIFVRCLAGVLGIRLSASDLQTALRNAALGSDGFWLFQYGDFPPSPPDDRPRHDPPDAYWRGIQALGEELAEAP